MATKNRTNWLFWLLVVPDLCLLYLSLWLTVLIRYGGGLAPEQLAAHVRAFSVIHLLWLLVFYIHGLFDVRSFRRFTTLTFNLATATVISGLVGALYFYAQPEIILTPRRFLLIHAVVSFALLLPWHLLVKYLLKNRFTQGLYLLMAGGGYADLEQQIELAPYLGFRSLGYLTESDLGTKPVQPGAIMVLPDNLQARPDLLKRLYAVRNAGVAFTNHRELYEQLTRRVYLSDLSEEWFLNNVSYHAKPFYDLVKRIVDILAGFLSLVVFALSYLVVAPIIKLTSPGPVLFVQPRVGKDGGTFRVFKYRTMSGGRTDTWTEKNDPRITRFGAFLRRTRIDELPQALNLLAGTMSLVGPRPEQVHIVERLRAEVPFYDERHAVKPGLTGWAQLNVYASSVEETKLKLQYDLYYIRHRSFWFDLEIILKTIYHVLTWQGR